MSAAVAAPNPEEIDLDALDDDPPNSGKPDQGSQPPQPPPRPPSLPLSQTMQQRALAGTGVGAKNNPEEIDLDGLLGDGDAASDPMFQPPSF
jgi:hypothetical protein